MRYKNKKTGAVIDVNGTLNGGDWEEEKAPSKPPSKKVGDKNVKSVRNNK